MDKQETFDIVVAHAREQGCKALDIHGDCQYRGPNGTKCFVGVLIPDDQYSSELESKNADSPRVAPVLRDLNYDPTFCYQMQNIHDICSVSDWEMEFEKFAGEHKLTYTPETP